MHVTTPLNELITALGMVGWEFKGLKVKNGEFVASAKNPQSGQDIERTGNSPEMAVHAVFQHAQRANTIRAFATRQIDWGLLQYKYGEQNGQDWQEATEGEEAQAASYARNQVAAKRSLAQEGPVDYWWPEWEHIDEASRRAVVPHQGYRDTGLIEGAVGNARMAHGYGQHGDIFDTAADIIAKIQRQQAVVEGNKRTATAVGLHFLQENGYDISRVVEEPFVSELIEAIWQISDAADPLGQAAIERTASILRQASVPLTKTAAWGESVPNVHYFDSQWDDTGFVYNLTQTDDSIHDGDILVVPSEGVVGIMVSAWPTAITENTGEFHDIDPNVEWHEGQMPLSSSVEEAWKALSDGRYWNSYQRAIGEANQLGLKLAAMTASGPASKITPIPCAITISNPDEVETYTIRPTVTPVPSPSPAPKPQEVPEKQPAKTGATRGEHDGQVVDEVEYGWKILCVQPGEGASDGAMVLVSPSYPTEWPSGVALESNQPIREGQLHGINAVTHEYMDVLEAYKTKNPWVLVQLSMWGDQWKESKTSGEAVIRSQYAYPYEIHVPANVVWFGKHTSDEIAKALKNHYTVDVVVRDLNAENYDVANWGYHSEEVLLGNGWTYQTLKENRGRIYLVVKDDQGQVRNNLTGLLRSTDFVVEGILDANDNPITAEQDPEAAEITKGAIDQLRKEKGWEFSWKQGVGQGQDQDNVETKVAWEEQEFDEPTDVIGLTTVWDKIRMEPTAFTEFVQGDGHHDIQWQIDESDIDGFGLPRWHLTQTEYAPRGVNLHPENWRNIMKEAVDAISQDNFKGKHIPEDKLDELAQAFYGVPTFLTNEETHGTRFDPSTLSQFFEDEINWGIKYAEQVLGESAWRQEDTLFPVEEYGQAIGLGAHPKLNRFFNLLSWYVHNGQKTAPSDKQEVWGEPQTPQWGEMALPGAIASTRDPDFIWIWYKSELRIEKWDHNLKHADMLRELFDEFGRDMNNEMLEVDPDQVGAGTVFEYSDGSYKVEHEQMNDPDVREYAEEAIEGWMKSWGNLDSEEKEDKEEVPSEDGWVIVVQGVS